MHRDYLDLFAALRLPRCGETSEACTMVFVRSCSLNAELAIC